MEAVNITICEDTREVGSPWRKWLGSLCSLTHGWAHPELKKPACLPTSDYCLASAFAYDDMLGEVVFNPYRTIERKTKEDAYGCMVDGGRERFSEMLMRVFVLWLELGTHTQVVVECTWPEFLRYATVERGMKPEAVRGTIRAWERRFNCPIVFCRDEKTAALYSFVFLTGAMQ